MPQKKYNKLTHAAIMKRKKPGRMGDGPGGYGLTALFRPTADGNLSRRLYQNIKIHGVKRTLPLGAYGDVSLEEARDIARENWRVAKAGADPRESKEEDSVEPEIPTCGDAMEDYIVVATADWVDSSKRNRGKQFRTYVLAPLCDMRVDAVTRQTLRDVFSPIRTRIPSSSGVLLNFTRGFFDWCIANNFRDDNPCDDALKMLLPRVVHRPTPFRSVPYTEISDTVAKIRSYPARDDAGKLLLELITHTGVRSQEGRLATLREFDLDNMKWSIPAEHTKRRRPFTVPLSAASARIVMRAMVEFEGRHPTLVFPTKRGNFLVNQSLRNIFNSLQLPGTTHGFRATFRTFCSAHGVQREVAELALNHQLTPLERSYIRGDLVEVRRPLMEAWSAYIQGTLPDDWMWGTHTVQESFKAVLAELTELRVQNKQLLAELAQIKAEA